MTDNVAVLAGFTVSVVAESDACTLYLLVKPDTDYDSTFRAWDTDAQEFINVNGWLFCVEPETDEPQLPFGPQPEPTPPPASNGIKVETHTMPACWASALVNGDFSGLNTEEASACKNAVAGLARAGCSVVSTVDGDEPRFTWCYDLYGGTARGGDVIDYIVHCK